MFSNCSFSAAPRGEEHSSRAAPRRDRAVRRSWRDEGPSAFSEARVGGDPPWPGVQGGGRGGEEPESAEWEEEDAVAHPGIFSCLPLGRLTSSPYLNLSDGSYLWSLLESAGFIACFGTFKGSSVSCYQTRFQSCDNIFAMYLIKSSSKTIFYSHPINFMFCFGFFLNIVCLFWRVC